MVCFNEGYVVVASWFTFSLFLVVPLCFVNLSFDSSCLCQGLFNLLLSFPPRLPTSPLIYCRSIVSSLCGWFLAGLSPDSGLFYACLFACASSFCLLSSTPFFGVLLRPSEVNKRGRPSKWPPERLPSKFGDFECAFPSDSLEKIWLPKTPFWGDFLGQILAPGRFCLLPGPFWICFQPVCFACISPLIVALVALSSLVFSLVWGCLGFFLACFWAHVGLSSSLCFV